MPSKKQNTDDMAELNLERFQKPKERMIVTSLNITRSQKDFLEEHGVELGSLVRDYLDKLMKEVEKRGIK